MYCENNCNIKRQFYFMDKEVLLVKYFSDFGLAKIKYLNNEREFIIDVKAICNEPDLTNTLSLRLLGGVTI